MKSFKVRAQSDGGVAASFLVKIQQPCDFTNKFVSIISIGSTYDTDQLYYEVYHATNSLI